MISPPPSYFLQERLLFFPRIPFLPQKLFAALLISKKTSCPPFLWMKVIYTSENLSMWFVCIIHQKTTKSHFFQEWCSDQKRPPKTITVQFLQWKKLLPPFFPQKSPRCCLPAFNIWIASPGEAVRPKK